MDNIEIEKEKEKESTTKDETITPTTTTTNTTTTTTSPSPKPHHPSPQLPNKFVAGKRKRKDDEIISIQDALDDALEEEKNLLEEAKLQEAEDWGDENSCTFDKGYINQSVFACKTCQTGDIVFGFCYGCSMHCHLLHEVYELFNKKDFRCDCGTKVQSGFKCQLSSQNTTTTTTTTTTTITSNDEPIGSLDKRMILNEKNHYNHNFKGKYCYCDSIYDYKEDMIQCIFCEDWFHENCLKLNSKVNDIPSPDEFSDLICLDCLNKNQFLLFYPHIRCYIVNDHIIIDDPPIKSTNTTTDNNTTTTTTTSTDNCKILGIEQTKKNIGQDLFCKENWREELCLCNDCKKIYKDKNLEFLFEKDEQDENSGGKTIDEEKTKIDILKMGQDVFDKSLPQTQQRALIEGFSDMKEKLKELFSKKLDSNQIVTKQDIDSIFKDLNGNKKFKK